MKQREIKIPFTEFCYRWCVFLERWNYQEEFPCAHFSNHGNKPKAHQCPVMREFGLTSKAK